MNLRFWSGRQEISLPEVRSAIANQSDIEVLRDVAGIILEGYVRLAGAIDAGAIVTPAPPPVTITFEAGALNVSLQTPAETPKTGVTVDYDQEGKVIGVTPKPA